MSKPPIYLNLLKIHLPIAGVSSITHRVSAVGIFILLLPFLFLLFLAVNSESGFDLVSFYFEMTFVKVFFQFINCWSDLSFYFWDRGISLWTLGIGETLEAGRNSAIGTFVVSFILLFIFTTILW